MSTGGELDPWLPRWHFRERHERTIGAAADHLFDALPSVDLADSPVVAPLIAIRLLPAKLARRAPPAGPTIDLAQLTMRAFLANGFVELARDRPRHLVVGMCGAFWRAAGGLVPVAPEAFAAHATPGTARLAWGFFFVPDAAGTRVVTETRIECADAAARRAMRAYWWLIRGPSGLIRREILRLLARSAGGQRALPR